MVVASTVLLFGTFDPLHDGHRNLFTQAAALGDRLVVVVARDSAIKNTKHRQPTQTQEQRLEAVQNEVHVDVALLGDEDPSTYHTLRQVDFDILAVGYDQAPHDDAQIQALLTSIGKPEVAVVRLLPFREDRYKSSYVRQTQGR